jgi:predicted GIY-YIG superfamily endonuclease
MPTAYRVYVLQNPEKKFYIGLSDNVTRRMGSTTSWAKNISS